MSGVFGIAPHLRTALITLFLLLLLLLFCNNVKGD